MFISSGRVLYALIESVPRARSNFLFSCDKIRTTHVNEKDELVDILYNQRIKPNPISKTMNVWHVSIQRHFFCETYANSADPDHPQNDQVSTVCLQNIL